MRAELVCFQQACRARYSIDEVLYECPACGGLLEVVYRWPENLDPANLRQLWRERRSSNRPEDQSGVWRYREIIDFLKPGAPIVSLGEGNTPLLEAPLAARYAGVERLHLKHQGFNPTGSFKDNGMTAGVSQALQLGMKRVACVSTGNTSASMAAYASAAGLQPVVLIPHGNIAFGKLAQALEYGARTLQIKANFDQILQLIRELAPRLGIYLLNSINPFRIEGQKTIMVELLDQRDWEVPDWIVLPGGNLGNVSSFGKGLREMKELGLISRLPRLAVIQAEGAAPFYKLFHSRDRRQLEPVANPETLATAIRIGNPVSWPKALFEVETSGGTVEVVSEQEIADAKAIIGRCGIGCEPASAASLAGLKKLVERKVIGPSEDVVCILTGHLLKDPDYIYRYHTGELKTSTGQAISSAYANRPIVLDYDQEAIVRVLEETREL